MDRNGVLFVSEKEGKLSQFDEDLDLAIALSLQGESSDVIRNGDSKSEPSSSKPLSLTDPQWELIDPNPDIYALFRAFDSQFFFGKLTSVEVKWSRQMTLCAGVCSYEGRGGLCSVRLSMPLLKLRPRSDLVETLLHEMIHAYLFVTANNKDHDAHGPQFLSHMNRINKQAGTKISVYHSFHDEVDYQRKHWWKCDGPCNQRRPFFGIVKRAMNRAPGPNDRWWAEHQASCGGKFSKIVEPENYKQKNLKRKQVSETKDVNISANIKSFFQPSTSSNPTPIENKKKKGTTDINKVKSIFSKEDNLVPLDRNDSKPPLPSYSSPKTPAPFSGQGFVLGSSETPTSYLSKIRKELGYTPLKAPQGNGKKNVKPNSKTETNSNLPKEEKKPNEVQVNKKKYVKSENLPKSGTKPAAVVGSHKHDASNIGLKGDSNLSVKPVKKEKLPIGNSKKSPAHSSTNKAKEKMKQGPLDKYVNSSPKGQEKRTVSQDPENNSTMVACPVCYNSFTSTDINMHLDQCLNN